MTPRHMLCFICLLLTSGGGIACQRRSSSTPTTSEPRDATAEPGEAPPHKSNVDIGHVSKASSHADAPPDQSTAGISGDASQATCHEADTKEDHGTYVSPLHVNGIFPSLAFSASSGPVRSECGTGAMVPWLDKLYVVSYLSGQDQGNGAALYAIHANFTMETLALHNSTFANRLIHRETNRIVIGAWTVDLDGRVQVFNQLLGERISSTAEHLTQPESMVYMLGMDGTLWECSLMYMHCKKIFDLVEVLNITGEVHEFKAAHTMNGRLVVTSSTFVMADFMEAEHRGRLAEWEGPGHDWKIIDTASFVEVTGRRNFQKVIYALGYDYKSVILKVLEKNIPDNCTANCTVWQTYRLPKASHAFDHMAQTEWPRIREVESDRYLMDMHGLFYELSPLGWAHSTWGVRPISQHLRVIPDFASFRGFLVLGGNQVATMNDNNVVTGQPQSGLWFGKTDDLWSFGKPQGWGALWRNDVIVDEVVSDPYLMTGFDKKIVHFFLLEPNKKVDFSIEVDVTGTSGRLEEEQWVEVATRSIQSSYRYAYYIFPTGFSAHWLRVRAKCARYSSSCAVTVYFHYT